MLLHPIWKVYFVLYEMLLPMWKVYFVIYEMLLPMWKVWKMWQGKAQHLYQKYNKIANNAGVIKLHSIKLHKRTMSSHSKYGLQKTYETWNFGQYIEPHHRAQFEIWGRAEISASRSNPIIGHSLKFEAERNSERKQGYYNTNKANWLWYTSKSNRNNHNCYEPAPAPSVHRRSRGIFVVW